MQNALLYVASVHSSSVINDMGIGDSHTDDMGFTDSQSCGKCKAGAAALHRFALLSGAVFLRGVWPV